MSATDELHLLARLEQVSPDSAGRIRRLAGIVDPMLARIYSMFPAYTNHGCSHSEHVIAILSWLLPSDMTEPLSIPETFNVLAAAYLHDIGMLEAVEAVGDREAQAQVRDSHHLRSQRYVAENYQSLGLDIAEARAIGEICRAHRKIDIAKEVSDLSDASGRVIRLQLLSAAVRIADELHLTADRAPQIVLDAIKPPPESLLHFKKHLSIGGVGPTDDLSTGVIRISATVGTHSQEEALRQMESDIQEELDQVRSIFARYDLPWQTIRLELQRRKVVERKIILYLAQFGPTPKGELATKVKEPTTTVENCIRDLLLEHYLEYDEETENVSLAVNQRTFEHWLREFLNMENEIDFVLSSYLSQCIEEFAFADFQQRFGASYDTQENEERILVLRSSPTALRLLLFVSEFQVEAAIIPSGAVLDCAMLLGFLTDTFRFPQITQIRGIGPAIGSIHNKIGQESQHLLRLLSALGPDRGREWREVFNDLVPPPELTKVGREDGPAFNLTVSHPADALQSGMTFPHLLKAAMISGESLELIGERIHLSSEDPRLSEATALPTERLFIIPRSRSQHPQTGVMFCRVEIDHERKCINLFTDIERTANYSKYPIVIRAEIPSDRRNATFNPSVYATNVDVRQALQIDQMFRWMASGDFHRLRIEPDQAEQLPTDVLPIEALGSDLKSKAIGPWLDDSYRGILQHLSHLQDQVTERIYCPIQLTDQQKSDIGELAECAESLDASVLIDKLRAIAEQAMVVLTTVRISTYFPNGQIESDEFFGPFPRFVPQITLQQSDKNRELAELLQKGEATFRIVQNFSYDVPTMKQKLAEGYLELDKRVFFPEDSEDGQRIHSACQVTIYPIQDKLWYREQIVHYQIRDLSTTMDICLNAAKMTKNGQAEEAISDLTQALERFPEEPLIPAHLGWIYYRAGDLGKAYEYSKKALTDPQYEMWSMTIAFADYNLGLFCLLQGKFDESLFWYTRATNSGPGPVLGESIKDLEAIPRHDLPEALYFLGFLYEHKGDRSQATDLYNQFLDSTSEQEHLRELAQEAVKHLDEQELTD